MHRKMARKGVSLGEVFDARALRVVVDDQGGRKLQQAIEACYAIQPAVHRLWRPIRGRAGRLHLQPQALRLPVAAQCCPGWVAGLLPLTLKRALFPLFAPVHRNAAVTC